MTLRSSRDFPPQTKPARLNGETARDVLLNLANGQDGKQGVKLCYISHRAS
jgi:hypothetical protein